MFGITTNGTLLSQERINFFKENNFSMLLSIDGAEETQCFNRPCRNPHLNSFKLIEKNIPALLEAYPNITFRSTIYAPTVEHLFENYLYAESLGFKSFVAIEDCRHGWTQEQLNQLDEEFQKIYCYRLEQIIKGIEPIKMSRFNGWLRYTTSILENKFNFYNGSSVMRCGLATTNGAIAYDGSIYGCQE